VGWPSCPMDSAKHHHLAWDSTAQCSVNSSTSNEHLTIHRVRLNVAPNAEAYRGALLNRGGA